MKYVIRFFQFKLCRVIELSSLKSIQHFSYNVIDFGSTVCETKLQINSFFIIIIMRSSPQLEKQRSKELICFVCVN